MIGAQVAKYICDKIRRLANASYGTRFRIMESKNKKFPVGKYVVGEFGWRTHTVARDTKNDTGPPLYLLPDLGDLPPSLGLGVLGMTG